MLGSARRRPDPRHRHLLSALVHLLLLSVSLLLAFALAYDFARSARWFFPQFMMVLPVVLLVKYAVFTLVGQHRCLWRYVGARDACSVAAACVACAVVLFALLQVSRWAAADSVLARIFFFPASVLAMDCLLSILTVLGFRLATRVAMEQSRSSSACERRTVIVGAGDAGETLLREIQRLPDGGYDIVGLLDDDPAKLGTRIHGAEVLGPIDAVKQVCRTHRVAQLLIAMPSAPRQRVRQIVRSCEGAGVDFRIVPALSELIEGRLTIESQLRQVRIEDLLHRDPVVLDHTAIGDYLQGTTVMVTGAGGSIGSEMCRQVLSFQPQRLVLVELSENNLFEMQRELTRLQSAVPVVPYLADVCDGARMAAIFERENPDIVCHAAAHKHVPMLEAHPGEGLKNNILGTRTLADLAAACGAHKFVYISTDKAVNPTSIMGCTKRIAERYVQGLGECTPTQFITVRFGNVLGSRGSVVPIFQEQIAAGGPLTVTHPRITRFFMTIPEAAQLVLQAGAIGRGGEIFLLEMGEAVEIAELAKNLITLSGLTPGVDIEIVFSGLRPGEKLHEELYADGEGPLATTHPNIRVWEKRRENWEALVQALPGLLDLADSAGPESIKLKLAELVPEYQIDYQVPGDGQNDDQAPLASESPEPSAAVSPVAHGA